MAKFIIRGQLQEIFVRIEDPKNIEIGPDGYARLPLFDEVERSTVDICPLCHLQSCQLSALSCQFDIFAHLYPMD